MIQVSFIVNHIFTSRTYIISDGESESVWLVDCGDTSEILEKIGNKTVKGVLLTHAHYDHIYGLPELLDKFPNCKIITNESGLETLADSRKNMSKYHENPIEITPSHPVICSDGDTIELFDGVMAKIHETPGHHPSCLTFEVGKYLFTGDAYIPNVPVVTNLRGGNKNQATESVNRILSMVSDGMVVCPGHEEMEGV